MPYAEASYFDHNHCQHCADRDDFLRRQRVRDEARKAETRRILTLRF